MTAHLRLLENAPADTTAGLWTYEGLIDLVLDAPENVPLRRLVAAIDEALRLCRGRLPGADAPAAVPQLENERLREKTVRALWRGAQALRAHGLHDPALAYLEKALEIDPSAEHCRRALALLNLALERNADILRSFARCGRQIGLAL